MMDVSQQNRTKKHRTLNDTVLGQNGNTGIVSITAESIGRVGRKSGNLTNVKETKEKKWMHEHPVQKSSPPAENAREQNRSPCGGRVDRNVTGDRTKKKEKIHKAIHRRNCSPHTGREMTEIKKKDQERSEGTQGRRPKRTQAGGHGRRIADGDNVRYSDVPQMTIRSTDTGSGSCTSQDHNTGRVQPVDHQPQLGIGSDFHVTFLNIISRLFPLDIKAECSASSTSTAVSKVSDVDSPVSSSFDETLAMVDALEKNFEDLANWFQSFERTKAHTVIGFDLAMEVCGCYDIIIRRLGKGLRDTFGDCAFIKSPQQVKLVDKALNDIVDMLKVDVGCALKTCLDDMSKLFTDETQSEFHTLQNTVKASDNEMILSSPHNILSFLKSQQGILQDVVSRMSRIAEVHNNRLSKCMTDLTTVRLDNSTLHSECEKAKSTITSLERRCVSLTEQMSSMSQLFHEDTTHKDNKNKDDIMALKKLLNKAQAQQEDATSNLREITHAHDAEKSRLNAQCAGLQKQLEETKRTLERMNVDHMKVKGDLEQQITALRESEENLEEVVLQLRKNNDEVCIAYKAKLLEAEAGINGFVNTISSQEEYIKKLVKTETTHTQRYNELLRKYTSLNEEIDSLHNINGKLSNQNRTLCALSQFLGVDMLKCSQESLINDIRLLKDASVERISKVLKDTCIRVGKEEDHANKDEGEEQEMDTNKGDMFIEYESQIGKVIEMLNSEHMPMEVNSVHVRSFKTPVKRKLAINTGTEYHPRHKQDSHSEGKLEMKLEESPGYMSAKDEDDTGVEIKIQTNYAGTKDRKGIPQRDKCFPSIEEHVSEDSEVCTFDITECSGNACAKVSIPKYITADLSKHWDVMIVDLGFHNSIDKLLDMLQVDQDTKTDCISPTPSTCHCLQMETISQRLKCTLVIYWAPRGGHEVYGSEHKHMRLYAIIVYIDKQKSHYLLSVQHKGCYMYNLAKLPLSSQIELPKDGFVHETDGTCQGPSLDLSSTQFILPTMHDVDSIRTSNIILHGNM